MSLNAVRVALDWTPNTIHTGLYVALEKGFYKDAGLDVELLPPDDDYSKTPAKQLENGEVDLAICPSESCIAYYESGRMHLQAIYAILQNDASAIVSCRPEFAEVKSLENATYGSYNARYEDSIVRSMVTAGGGDGSRMKIKNSSGKLSLFEELKQGGVDATWVFMPWEGVEADLEGIKLHAFKTEDYGVPYGYSPVIARNANTGPTPDVLRKFLIATRQGYTSATKNPGDAIDILRPHCRPQRSFEFLEKSQNQINAYYSSGVVVGEMQHEKWEEWISWLFNKGLVTDQDIDTKKLYTNDFFRSS